MFVISIYYKKLINFSSSLLKSDAYYFIMVALLWKTVPELLFTVHWNSVCIGQTLPPLTTSPEFLQTPLNIQILKIH